MTDERRRSPRARIAQARVHCESASGRVLSGRGGDLGRGGLFVQSSTLLPVGKRVTLEIEVPGELATWSAVGRVVWTRAPGDPHGRPAGLGIAFIDVGDAVLAAIGRLLARTPETPASTRPPDVAPSRERTVLGVGVAAEPAVAAAPILQAAPARERTVLGIAPAPQGPASSEPPPRLEDARTPEIESASDLPDWPDEPPPDPSPPPAPAEREVIAGPAPERSVPIDLVAKPTSPSPPPPPDPSREPSLSPAGVPRRGGGAPLMLGLLLALAASGYAMRARLRPWIAPYLPAGMYPTPAAAPPATPATAEAPTAGASPGIPVPASASARAVAMDAQAAAPATSVPHVASSDAGMDASRATPPSASGSAPPLPAPSAHRPPPPAPKPRPAPTARATGEDPYE